MLPCDCPSCQRTGRLWPAVYGAPKGARGPKDPAGARGQTARTHPTFLSYECRLESLSDWDAAQLPFSPSGLALRVVREGRIKIAGSALAPATAGSHEAVRRSARKNLDKICGSSQMATGSRPMGRGPNIRLTKKQRKLLKLIEVRRRGLPTVQRDLAEALGVRRDSLNKLLARTRRAPASRGIDLRLPPRKGDPRRP